ncbi:MAG: ribose 5-phosphate isomerase A [Desulfurococcales archaeon]|nr:ribose 5-phosphate isomerase A [Desulfurococcales archaeon]
MDQEVLKAREHAIKEALKLLRDAEVVGIGTGSTMRQFIEAAHREGALEGAKLVTSSLDTALTLKSLGYDVLSPLSVNSLDVYVDSADEVSSDGVMIKGGGGALTMEKILTRYSKLKVFVVDWRKLREGRLTHPIPIEVLTNALTFVLKALRDMGLSPSVRDSVRKKGPVITDSLGVVVDVEMPTNTSLRELDTRLRDLPGIVETGIFADLHDVILVGYPDGRVLRIGKGGKLN